MKILRTEHDLSSFHAGVLVPTMGALHEGHAALIRHAVAIAYKRGIAAGCIVSIFVNPTQFNQKSDFDRYPRTLDDDARLCAAAGARAVFSPEVSVVYPLPPAPAIAVPPLPSVATDPGLEDHFRPGHFSGVCQVVHRLFELTQPSAAVFGEKDWQQLQVVAAMARSLHSPIEIVPHPTLRAADGLALSSRNRFLSPSERESALAIPKALQAAGRISDPLRAESAMRDHLEHAGLKVEYAVVRDRASLRPIAGPGLSGRALIAAWSGGVRLIDNAPWPNDAQN